MQIAYHQAVEQLGHRHCLLAAAREAYLLIEALARVNAGAEGRIDQLAAAVAEVEVACEQLRLIAGPGLVELHKVEALARLQAELRANAASIHSH